jgi:pimeloyl-ACP methyl ester carboxylesterase
MKDLVVIVPGITGSALSVDEDRVWGVSGRAVIDAVRTFGRNVDRLALPQGFGDTLPVNEGEGEPGGKVCATGLIGGVHFIPGVWSPVKGYGPLSEYFEREFTMIESAHGRPGNLLRFPYDWRLSNVVSARRLRDKALTQLEAWKKESNNDDARLVLVCHSMGGLVARWFLEKLEGWQSTRWLITIGTPYQGSMMALDGLANGMRKGPRWIGKDLTPLVRSFPSMYELLPIYKCYDPGTGTVERLSATSGHGLDGAMLASAEEFHRELADAVAERPQRGYRIMAIKGVTQPTAITGKARAHGIELSRLLKGVEARGDGTVPRPSAHPPEWPEETDGDVVGYSQRHATLQETDPVFTQLFTRLTAGELGRFMGGEDIGVDVPHAVDAGEDLHVEALCKETDRALTVSLVNLETGDRAPQTLMTARGDGSYEATIGGLPPGLYEIETGAGAGSSTAVRDVVTVWDELAEP